MACGQRPQTTVGWNSDVCLKKKTTTKAPTQPSEPSHHDAEEKSKYRYEHAAEAYRMCGCFAASAALVRSIWPSLLLLLLLNWRAEKLRLSNIDCRSLRSYRWSSRGAIAIRESTPDGFSAGFNAAAAPRSWKRAATRGPRKTEGMILPQTDSWCRRHIFSSTNYET